MRLRSRQRCRTETRKTFQGELTHTTNTRKWKADNREVSTGVGHMDISSDLGLSSFRGCQRQKTE